MFLQAFIAASSIAAVTPAYSAEIVFSAWGGTMQEIQKEAWADPFTATTGIAVKQDGPTDYGKVQAMVESGQPGWDVVDVEGDYAIQAGQKGLLEKLDFGIIDKTNLDPRFVTDYSVGGYFFAFVIGCNKDAVEKCPQTWADLFDTAQFPGKRTFYKWSSPGVVEAALLADGVQPDDLYPLDLDRAFRKLDTIKSDIIWWSGGAQSQQLLASGEAPYGSFWNGRMTMLAATGVPLEVSWNQNIAANDSLVVLKGSKNKEAAMKFIALATSAEVQAHLSTKSAYAPANVKAVDFMDAEIVKTLPDKETATQINANMHYWADHRDEIGQRWYEWQAR